MEKVLSLSWYNNFFKIHKTHKPSWGFSVATKTGSLVEYLVAFRFLQNIAWEYSQFFFLSILYGLFYAADIFNISQKSDSI